jgi:hypothetical protein
MASFAKLNSNNIVEQVLSVHNNELLDNGVESETIGVQFLKNLYGEDTNWKQTSYNTHGGIHNNGGTPFRKNHAGIGYIYDENRDAFIPIKPYNSWILNEETCTWNAPVAKPTTELEDNQYYTWNEETQSWTLQTI